MARNLRLGRDVLKVGTPMATKNIIRKLPSKSGFNVRPDDRKLTELVVLLASRSQSDPLFGSVKLNKLLFYCDFLAYAALGKPITGQQYFALANGPALKRKTTLWHTMEKKKDIAVRREDTRFNTQRETTLALRNPDVTVFSSPELDLIYRVLVNCKDMDGNDLSELSHRFPGWELAREKEPIPYTVALIGGRPPSHAEVKIAACLAAELEVAA